MCVWEKALQWCWCSVSERPESDSNTASVFDPTQSEWMTSGLRMRCWRTAAVHLACSLHCQWRLLRCYTTYISRQTPELNRLGLFGRILFTFLLDGECQGEFRSLKRSYRTWQCQGQRPCCRASGPCLFCEVPVMTNSGVKHCAVKWTQIHRLKNIK